MGYIWLPPSKNHVPLWEGRMLEKISLENGLVLEIWNYSRKLAGDRWLIGFLAQIGVEPSKEDFSEEKYYKMFLEKTDGKVYYRYRKERTFISEELVWEIFKNIKENFLRAAVPYLSHPEFKEKLIKYEVKVFEQKIDWEISVQIKDEEEKKWEELLKDREFI